MRSGGRMSPAEAGEPANEGNASSATLRRFFPPPDGSEGSNRASATLTYSRTEASCTPTSKSCGSAPGSSGSRSRTRRGPTSGGSGSPGLGTVSPKFAFTVSLAPTASFTAPLGTGTPPAETSTPRERGRSVGFRT